MTGSKKFILEVNHWTVTERVPVTINASEENLRCVSSEWNSSFKTQEKVSTVNTWVFIFPAFLNITFEQESTSFFSESYKELRCNAGEIGYYPKIPYMDLFEIPVLEDIGIFGKKSL